MDILRVTKLKKSRKFAGVFSREYAHSIHPTSRNLLTQIYGMTLNISYWPSLLLVTKVYISVTLRE